MQLLDEAAICMLALAKQPVCFEDPIEEEICIMVCCCKIYPIIKSRRLMQKCVNMLMESSNSLERGYENSVPYNMNTRKPLPIDNRPGRRVFREIKELTGNDDNNLIGKMRIPDVTVYDAHGNTDYVYEIKFPGDYWRDGQYCAYVKLMNNNKDKVIELNNEKCQCDTRKEDRSLLTDEEKKLAAELSRQYFIADWEANKETISGILAGVGDAELARLIPELRSAVHNAKTLGEKLAPLLDPLNFIPFGKLGRVCKAANAGKTLPSPGTLRPIPVK